MDESPASMRACVNENARSFAKRAGRLSSVDTCLWRRLRARNFEIKLGTRGHKRESRQRRTHAREGRTLSVYILHHVCVCMGMFLRMRVRVSRIFKCFERFKGADKQQQNRAAADVPAKTRQQ